MAHFAKLDENNIVTKVVVVHNDVATSESAGAAFLNNMYGTSDTWKQTSYNTYKGGHKLGGTAFRKNFAGINYRYDSTLDAFIRPQPFASFTLNETTCIWEAPVTMPDDGAGYIWNETVYNNDNSKGWVRTSG